MGSHVFFFFFIERQDAVQFVRDSYDCVKRDEQMASRLQYFYPLKASFWRDMHSLSSGKGSLYFS